MSASFNLSEWALRHRALIGFFMVVVLFAGIRAYEQLGRNEDPVFTIRTMVVQTNWPGANIDDTLREVTDRVEKKLQETPHLGTIRSYTVAGKSTVFVDLHDSTRSEQIADIWYQVRKKIGDIRATLPSGIQGPFFNDEFGDTYALIYAFTADGISQRELRDTVEDIRTRLLQIGSVAKVHLIGAQDERIYLEFSVRELAGLQIDPTQLIRQIQQQNAVTPSGVMQTGDDRVLVEVSGGLRSEEDLKHINLSFSGKSVPLPTLAQVRRGYADPPQPTFRFKGANALGLGITMKTGANILDLGHRVEKEMASIVADLPIGIEPHLVAEQPRVVEESVDEFMKALWEAVAIVLVVSFLSLGVRAGAVVALSIPLVLAAVFVLMEFTDIDLQRVSLGALIIALGLLVDDAMITVEMMVSKLEEGLDKVAAASFAYQSTAFPMLTGTLVTVIAFVPVGFAKSAAGEYTYSIFAVVAMALLISWVVAVLFAPLLGAGILKEREAHQGHDEDGRLLSAFKVCLETAMRARWITIAITLVLLLTAILVLPLVPQQFFPASDRPELLVNISLPKSASIEATEKAAVIADDIIAKDADIESWSTYIGQGAVRFYLSMDVQLANDFFAQAVVISKDLESRDRVQARLSAALAERIPGADVRVAPLELGPPVGWPVQFRVQGPEPSQVRSIAARLAERIASVPGAGTIIYDWMEPIRVLRIDVLQDEARRLGVSSESIANAINTVVSGTTVTQIRDDNYLINVVMRGRLDERTSPAALRTLELPTASGRAVALAQLAKVRFVQDAPMIWRRDRVPTLTVKADSVPGVLSSTVIAAVQAELPTFNAALPPGYRVTAGGTAEKSAESMASLFAVIPAASALMLLVLMVQLQSVGRMLLVLSVAPFGLIGVVLALLIAQKPLGFVAMLGIIALVGMIVRNSVILVDQIETEIGHGHAPWDAVRIATLHRFRPIILTAAAAILGMIPIAPTVFWGPMAFAIMGGLAVATLLTLLFLPALYLAAYRITPPAKKGTEQFSV
ncbi:MAG: efflux RND transporter permease subunit [Dokdonella sp.]|nr:efflux RND transporter permease subunit [Xanthomonadales bacterium]MCB1573857.1 efflux RND transporter permease subunit [Xanthomonadales bacterium]MCB1576439.1 efflux RND transporter permease subunit [Xanthomonadales bacterium]